MITRLELLKSKQLNNIPEDKKLKESDLKKNYKIYG